MKVFFVFGAPCSGKTTWVHNRLTNGDVVFDFDAIVDALTLSKRKSFTDIAGGTATAIARLMRMAFIEALPKGNTGTAYVISMNPMPYIEAQAKALGHRTLVKLMPTSEQECLKRLKASDREHQITQSKTIREWFQNYGEAI